MLPHYYRRSEIDDIRWNTFIGRCVNAMPYSLTWYLDAVSPSWGALILDDNDKWLAVMPLPEKTKFGMTYLTQPFWCQQLGVFAEASVTSELQQCFMRSIPHSIYALKCNYGSVFGNKQRNVETCANYILRLNSDYNTLWNSFHDSCKRNIKRALHDNEIRQISADMFMSFYKGVAEDDIRRVVLKELINSAAHVSAAEFYGAFHHEQLVSALFIIRGCNRIINLVPYSTTKGKETRAMFGIINELIRANAGTSVVLDFEGSTIEGVSRFYRGFGADCQPYFFVTKNHPQWLIKLIHR